MTQSQGKPTSELWRPSDKDLQYKQEKRLCFRCDDKWIVGHHCKRCELSLLITQEEEEVESEPEEDANPVPVIEADSPDVASLSKICLNSMFGRANPKTIKLRGYLFEEEVVVMIDPRATHNLVSLNLVKISATPSEKFGVALGTRVFVQRRGKCEGILLIVVFVQRDIHAILTKIHVGFL